MHEVSGRKQKTDDAGDEKPGGHQEREGPLLGQGHLQRLRREHVQIPLRGGRESADVGPDPRGREARLYVGS